ncbi:bifunctional 2-polyprenyl-6-hydroxyphenol methylase/3-demethylubiquinol 3-O-methyltransferase UbiG [Amycolatopsis sp. BJA-103]|uniref:class I SAM-dependent methyltransferase n=1 Tax=Amycolatopsis sp. BJA-103 TaxID=1911175 RepID=UPI000C76A6DE|nr:class I SAM-dependent methyltransferase [Amycolatopsis sp. BJA-103]AUI57111.1 methyltransferase [Amycolatopsis sp. BJA-103]PNE15388.1 SAM-dependent methyltransferase [Amycolatopsis sp. BJA-103]
MGFNHNDHYHPLLLDQLPPGPGVALEVGCGSGRFARRLAATGMHVEAIDRSGPMVDLARAAGSPGPGTISYRQADVSTEKLPGEAYDFISCLASLHHVPFETVTKLRDALVPGGVLAVLGLGKPSTPFDYARALVASPVNALARVVVYAGERLNGGIDPLPAAPIKETFPPMNRIRRDATRLLPGSKVRNLLFFRYLLVYRRPEDDHPM